MFKAIVFTLALFAVVFGSVRALNGLNVVQLESLISEVAFAAGISLVVAFIVTAFVILF